MKVPAPLASAFGKDFEELMAQFCTELELLPDPQSLSSTRYLGRSIVPHVGKLSDLFNRVVNREERANDPAKRRKAEAEKGLAPYWRDTSNPAHLRLAYFLYFMPPNLFRVASVWAELARLGFRWPAGKQLRAVEFGAGPAAGATGIAAAEKFAPVGLPSEGSWALIEQDKATLELGAGWSRKYFEHLELPNWEVRPFHRKIDLSQGLLPPAAPRFNLCVMSYFLNESSLSPGEVAAALDRLLDKHVEEDGLLLILEPALKAQSRKLLEIRRALLQKWERTKGSTSQVLLPCLGHQACGALAGPEDWCHEEVMWWRPPYFRVIDKLAGLDRKSLPFSYLVITRSSKAREELLPALKGASTRHRLVSPAHSEGKEREFFVCGVEGKKRARYRPRGNDDPAKELDRGDLLLDAEIRGDSNASRVEKIGGVR